MGSTVDEFGDKLQNDCNHTTRHAEPLKRWVAAIRAAHGRSGVELEPTKYSVYFPGAQPKNATRRGEHVIYEQKVASPISTAIAGTSSAGAQAAFANTEDALRAYIGSKSQ